MEESEKSAFQLAQRFTTLPNQLTGIRFLAVPVMWLFAFRNEPVFVGVGLIVALVTDALDGHTARALNLVSEFGAKFASPPLFCRLARMARFGSAKTGLGSSGVMEWLGKEAKMDQVLPTPRQFFFVQRALRLLFAGLLDWRVTGMENIPRQGRVLVALNHTSFLDVVLPAMFFPRPIVSFAKIEVFRSLFLGPLFRWMRMVPVCRGEVDRDALRHALRVLECDGVFAVAPEGTRTPEGKLIRAKPGVALLAAASRAPVLPLAMWGATRGGFATNLRHLRRTRVEAVLGEPLRLREGVTADRALRQAIADDLMLHIACLLPQAARGYYSDPADFPTRYFEPLGVTAVKSGPVQPFRRFVSSASPRQQAVAKGDRS